MTDGTRNGRLDDRLTRRAFLSGAVSLGGVLALGWSVRPADGAARPGSAPLALAFLDGSRLVDATRLPQGEAALCQTGVRLTVHGRVGTGQTLRGLSAHFLIHEGSQAHLVPFHAWAGSPHGNSHDAAFVLPLVPPDGLHLTVRHAAGADADAQETLCLLTPGNAPGQAKLRAGTYVLMPAGADWSRCHYEASGPPGGQLFRGTADGLVPAGFDHLILTVRPA